MTLNIADRIFYLNKLKKELLANEDAIVEALCNDLKKPEFETKFFDYYIIINEINYFIKHIKKFAKKQRVAVPWYLLNTKAYLYPEPYGHVLIIGPWNFPFQLTLLPLVGVVAAGNIATIKPSEVAIHSEALMVKIIKNVFPEEIVNIVTGGPNVTINLLKQKFDLIFFTGSAKNGKSIMRAAAEHLTPVVLELGGKNPMFVEDSTSLDLVAADICLMKFLNSGQNCQAIDYLLVNEKLKTLLLEKIINCIKNFYGANPKQSPHYGKIINKEHCQRLVEYLCDVNIIYGGDYNIEECYFSPTIVELTQTDNSIMKEEIFGPILPIISYENLDDAIALVNRQEKPLVLYCVSNNKLKCKKILNSISSGGVDINGLGNHFINWNLPFGGIGYSGMGVYHRKASFNSFTHYKPVSETFLNVWMPIKYPPYFKNKWLFKFFR
jgi:acyl-CoA reductase-like NAD-dependent aldehyde dehydrogenase